MNTLGEKFILGTWLTKPNGLFGWRERERERE